AGHPRRGLHPRRHRAEGALRETLHGGGPRI
ncbi:MAG: hypothetical protein AVDCRST_MAG12-2671, partial [uncultured Rubrobacteraceae bacterium]